MEYPHSKDGEALRLLAQINFEELPPNDAYPQKGLLQFYISPSDDVYGLDFDNGMNQDKFRLMYFKDLIQDEEKLISDFDFLKRGEEEYFPIQEELKLSFIKDYEAAGVEEWRIINLKIYFK